MFFHLSELDVRTLEHNRRLNDANRFGWLRASVRRAGAAKSFGSVLGAVGHRFAPGMPGREQMATSIGCDDSAVGSAVGSVA